MNDINYDLSLQLDQLEQSLVKWGDFHHYNNIKLKLTDDLVIEINNLIIYISKDSNDDVLLGYLSCDVNENQWLWELNDKEILCLNFELPNNLCSVTWN